MMENFGRVLLDLLIWLIGIPTVLGAVTVAISRRNKVMVVALDGFNAQLIFGWLGIIIHECSHLLLALIFGHHLGRVALIRMPDKNNPNDNSLGYVSHSWNDHNFYQRAGNLFIGIAPVIGCSVVMALATRYLATPVYNSWQSLFGFGSPASGAPTWWQWILWLIIIVNISIGGFDLSRADLQNASHGLIVTAILLVVAAGILSVTVDVANFAYLLQGWLLPLYACLVLAICLNAVLWLILRGRMRRRNLAWLTAYNSMDYN